MTKGMLVPFAAMVAMAGLPGCSRSDSGSAATTNPGEAASGHTPEQAKNLANFDDLDFRVYSGQKWDEFSKSHAPDIVVHYPDGSTTTGLAPHLEKLKPQFGFAPDTRIREHPIKLADGHMTAVQGIMEGTFTRPMDLGNGKSIKPTGRKFRLEMVTIGRWEDGLMKEEWLYWDNAAFMNQVGAVQ
jgi:hypothetical protein